MKSLTRNLSTFVILAGAGFLVYSWQRSGQQEAKLLPGIQNSVVHPSPSPTIRYPVPETDQTPVNGIMHKPMPSVDESDQSIEGAFSELFGKERFESLFILKDIVRRIVVTIDNATKHQQPSEEFLPLKLLEPDFRVTSKGKERSISPDNFRRYLPYIALAQAVNTQQLVGVYVHFYSLFQSAYRDLGTQGYFNDRLIEVIDSLLETPDPKGLIQVVRLGVRYKYKYMDDQLEALSFAQKILIRMGYENAQVIEAKLRQLRSLLIHLKQ